MSPLFLNHTHTSFTPSFRYIDVLSTVFLHFEAFIVGVVGIVPSVTWLMNMYSASVVILSVAIISFVYSSPLFTFIIPFVGATASESPDSFSIFVTLTTTLLVPEPFSVAVIV